MDIIEFEKIYHKSFNILCNKAYRMINDADAARDIVQNVFLRVWDMKETLVISTTMEGYLYKAVINESLNYLDTKKRFFNVQADKEVINIAGDKSSEEEIHFAELQQKVNDLLDQLPPKCRKVFLLSRFEEMTYKEIADFLNISVNTVDNHIKKALDVFRKALKSIVLIFH
jgi:RNA polymerase sigma-70 factor, ECF subfamily